MLGGPARADTLLTGAIRDRAGAAVAGARVTAFDAAGAAIGADVALADGTFAVAARGTPATVAIACDYCQSVTRRVVAGEPVVVIVARFNAVTELGPSAQDIRALPYRGAADIASLRPFTVNQAGAITDRGLAAQGALAVDGLPFYNPVDGSTASGLLPAHSSAALDAASPLAAPAYGGYAAAGVYDLRLRDPDLSTSRADIGDAGDVVARLQTPSAGAGYAASSDTGDDRQAAWADANLPFAGGRLSFDAVDLDDLAGHASGAGLGYATDSRRFTTTASLSATQIDATSLLALSGMVQNRGPLGLEFGARVIRASSAIDGAAGAQFDAALYAAATRETHAGSIAATIGFDHGSDSGISAGSQAAALIGSLSDDLRLGSRWMVHLGGLSDLRIPTFAELPASAISGAAGERSVLFEQSLTYADLHRLRLTSITYTQRSTSSVTGHVNGIGLDAAWQIAPQLSLRTWLLRANQSTAVPGSQDPSEYPPAYPAAYAPYSSAASALTRQLVWLSYENYVRFDALIRGGALEGDVRIPLGAMYAFAIGTARYDGRRVTTFGLTHR